MSESVHGQPRVITCVGVETELPLLPHFIDHYLGLGVAAERIHTILNTTDAASENLAAATEIVENRGLAAPEHWIGVYTSDSMWEKRRALQLRVADRQDWILSADVDEFHEYPAPLADILAYCEHSDINCLQGVLIDRLAPDGRLVPVGDDRPIESQFPVQADVQCSIGQTGTYFNYFGSVKLMAFKAGIEPGKGGHQPLPPDQTQNSDQAVHYAFGRELGGFPRIGAAGFRFFVPFRVHHYKWTATLEHTLTKRLDTPGVSPAGAEYGRKLLDYLSRNDGIALSEVPTRRASTTAGKSWKWRLACMNGLNAFYWYRSRVGSLRHKLANKREG